MFEVIKQTTDRSKTAEHFCTTILKQASTSMEWTITNFKLFQTDSYSLESSSFESVADDVHTGAWKLKLFPKYNNEDKVGLFFACEENLDHILAVKCEACIIDAEGKDVNKKVLSSQQTLREIGFEEFIKNSSLEESLLSHGNLIIRCIVTVIFRNQTNIKRNDDVKFDHRTSLPEDFLKLLKDELLSDAVLHCDGKKFPVHKCVLSARSSVFRFMFTDGSCENEKHLIEVKDIDPGVLQNLLDYIYTDNILNCSSIENAIKLLRAAEDCNLLGLRGICVEYIKKNISTCNVLHVAIVADLHSLESLKEVCITFICQYGIPNSKVFCTNAPKYLLEGVIKRTLTVQFLQREFLPNQNRKLQVSNPFESTALSGYNAPQNIFGPCNSLATPPYKYNSNPTTYPRGSFRNPQPFS